LKNKKKKKEYLKLIGVRWEAIWLASWIRSIIRYIFLSILIAIITKIEMDPSIKHYRFAQKKILQNTHFLVILSLLLVYSMQVSIFVLLVAQFFKKSKQLNYLIFNLNC
jgi:predicted PurR-regulated permease PerM